MLKIGVIGYGYWGPNMVRNFMEIPDSTVKWVSDLSEKNLERAQTRYPTLQTTTDYNDILNDGDVDAVVIATPVDTHYPLAKASLEAGKHVLVEKPMASKTAHAEELIAIAEAKDLTLMVDHTFVYTGGIRKIADIVREGTLGDVYYYDSTRVNLGLFQHDVNVMWDLAVHDLSIIEYVFNREPTAVSATGMSHVAGQPENVAYFTVYYDDTFIAHINVNWLAPVKVRRMLIGGSKQMIVYDELEPSEKLKIYDKGITVNSDEDVYKLMIGYRAGDMHAPKIEMTEALRLEAQEFCACIREGKTPTTDGQAGLRVVKILEAAEQSIAQRGAVVALK
jgi:predicted dehydrogenase